MAPIFANTRGRFPPQTCRRPVLDTGPRCLVRHRRSKKSGTPCQAQGDGYMCGRCERKMESQRAREGPIPLFIFLHVARRLPSHRLFQTVNPPPLWRACEVMRADVLHQLKATSNNRDFRLTLRVCDGVPDLSGRGFGHLTVFEGGGARAV